MPETLAERKKADEQFFARVRGQQLLQDALLRNGFDRQTIGPSQHNSVLLFTKDEWTLPRLPGQTKGLNVHYETRKKRHELRLEIGLDPYEGNVADKPDLFSQIQPVLAQKAQLVEQLRAAVLRTNALPAQISTNSNRLYAPEDVRSHTIVKFTSNLPSDASPADTAGFFAEVIDAITPVVAGILRAEVEAMLG